ncbi:AhpC/TSA family protein [Pustulibacterium marinum]|uniref:AhpC/TSA family protein n=1 Tax=Pustulibacterium marinum TaxID=1224947 RepID=A0A1I7FR56_9FLAO|nr:TlpA disulfide reductase family protein [Pustulibacterium marinum]SFU38653.1 AhpC/TSA family protein [Pustulibacterium marinum]
MKKKTFLNLLLILFVLSFFVTPLGRESKILLIRAFAKSPDIQPNSTEKVDFDWKLKEKDNTQYNFEKSKGNVVFVNFWATWRLTSIAELKNTEALYDDYKDKVDFYIITNELPQPVDSLKQARNYHFQESYLIMNEKMPFDAEVVPSGYIIDKKGNVVAKSEGTTNWNTEEVRNLLDKLIAE